MTTEAFSVKILPEMVRHYCLESFLGPKDSGNAVQVVIDQALWQADALQCHPLVNTATLVIPHEGVEKFFQETKHEPRIIDVPGRYSVETPDTTATHDEVE